jgi:hypothetical protein
MQGSQVVGNNIAPASGAHRNNNFKDKLIRPIVFSYSIYRQFHHFSINAHVLYIILMHGFALAFTLQMFLFL